MIKIENITKKFKENTVLNNVSINFEKGKIHGLIGRNGSGKTVLIDRKSTRLNSSHPK